MVSGRGLRFLLVVFGFLVISLISHGVLCFWLRFVTFRIGLSNFGADVGILALTSAICCSFV